MSTKFGMKLVIPVMVGGMAVLVWRILYYQTVHQKDKRRPIASSLAIFTIVSAITLALIILSENKQSLTSYSHELTYTGSGGGNEEGNLLMEKMLLVADMSGTAPF
jgi:hypothetical protein